MASSVVLRCAPLAYDPFNLALALGPIPVEHEPQRPRITRDKVRNGQRGTRDLEREYVRARRHFGIGLVHRPTFGFISSVVCGTFAETNYIKG
jgi:hypothetical protein